MNFFGQTLNRINARKPIVAIAVAVGLIFSQSAAAAEICYDRAFTDELRFDIDVGWDVPNPLDPNPDPVTANPDRDKILAALRALEGGWRTPTGIWPTSAVTIVFIDRGLTVCQAIYSRDHLYATNADNNGFVVRAIDTNTIVTLNEALGLSRTTPR